MKLENYQRALEEGRVVFIGDINIEMLYALRKQMQEVCPAKTGQEIIVLLQSVGGGVEIGYAMYNEIQALATRHKVTLICQATVCSMATLIMLAVPCERRFAFQFTRFYCHWPYKKYETKVEGYLENHKYSLKEHEALVTQYEEEFDRYASLFARGVPMSRKKAERLLGNPRDIYPEEAIKLGFIKGVLK